MRCSITLLQFAERAQITSGAVAKGNLLLFGLLVCGIRELHPTQITFYQTAERT
jgi:hypothetical protein